MVEQACIHPAAVATIGTHTHVNLGRDRSGMHTHENTCSVYNMTDKPSSPINCELLQKIGE